MIVIITKTKTNIKINVYDPVTARKGMVLESFPRTALPEKVLSAAIRHAGSRLRVHNLDCLKP